MLSVCHRILTLVLIGQAIFLLEHGQTDIDRQTNATECPTNAMATAGMIMTPFNGLDFSA